MKKKICILTATRAEYGLLKRIIERLIRSEEFDVRVAVTGMHLSPEFGLTYKEIEKDGIPIDRKIEMLLSGDTPASISKSMGVALIGFADYFEELRPDCLLVLGDRYETLAVCMAAMNQRIPIAHLYGGETTEGAVDESIRHAITKLSYLHMTSTAEYRKRVIQLGESPDRVHQVGAIGIENIKKMKLLSKKDLEQSIDFKLEQPYAVVTFHPVTLEENQVEQQMNDLLWAIDQQQDMKFVFTKANSDANGRIINRMIDEYVAEHQNTIAFASLGVLRYLSALNYADMVIGNSSSGLTEAPTFGIPTVNIGDRQKGRLQSESVINCIPERSAIEAAIQKAKSETFRSVASQKVNPYGDGETSEKVVSLLIQTFIQGQADLKKPFYTIEFEVE